MNFQTVELPQKASYNAPDGSEIRLLWDMNGGGLSHCTLPPKRTSFAVTHKTIEEIWYFVQGHGQVWRKLGDQESEVDVEQGICLTIPSKTHFQFRNIGSEPLCFIIAPCRPGRVRKRGSQSRITGRRNDHTLSGDGVELLQYGALRRGVQEG
jgi:mannose-6-phosphate isomerase-like protein (cupin superfamily)